MDLFPDPFKPLSDKSAADLANEYWMFNEVTKGNSERDEFDDFWDDDLDHEFEDNWDSEFEDLDFVDAADVPPVFVPPVVEETEEEEKKIKAVKAVKHEKPAEEPEVETPVTPAPPAQNGPGGAKFMLRLIFGLIIIAGIIYAWNSYRSGNEARAKLDRTTVSTRSVYSSTSSMTQSSVEQPSSVSTRQTNRYAGHITRKSTSRTKEDYYGVDDYVDAADFADEMRDEFDDWEDAYDYYEEHAE